jgi:alpha/beta superfamily hydrolase
MLYFNRVDFFLLLLKDPHYFVDALVAISDWFGFEPEKVENVIKLSQNIRKIMEVFKFAEQQFAGGKKTILPHSDHFFTEYFTLLIDNPFPYN